MFTVRDDSLSRSRAQATQTPLVTQSLASALLLAASALLAGPAAAATVLDFEGFDAGTIIDDEYAGVLISAENFNNDLDVAVLFDSNNVTGGDFDLGAPFFRGEEINNPGNILIIQENGPCSTESCVEPDDEGARAAGKFFIEFAQPVELLSIDFFDIEEPESMGTIRLFGESGELPDMFAVPNTGGDNTWDSVLFNVSGVTGIEIYMGGSGAIDNITYEAAAPVPLPAAAWLFGSTLGLAASLRRRKRPQPETDNS